MDADPITEATTVQTTVNVIEKTGVFVEALRDWRKKPEAEKTWKTLQSDFNYANKERLRTLTTKKADFHRAFAARMTMEATLAEAQATIKALQAATISSLAAHNNQEPQQKQHQRINGTTVGHMGWATTQTTLAQHARGNPKVIKILQH